MNFVSWVYENYIEKLVLPWGLQQPVVHFNAYALVDNMLVIGVINLYSSKPDTKDDDFDYLQFIDSLLPFQREVVNQNVKFHICLRDFRELAFYETLEFLLSEKSIPITPTTKNQNSQPPQVDEPIGDSNFIFCKIVIRLPEDHDDKNLRPFSTSYKIENQAVFYTFVFGLSTTRSIFLMNKLQFLCPFMNILRSSNSDTDTVQNNPEESSVESGILIEKVIKTSKIFSADTIRQLIAHFPERSQVLDIILVYSNLNHGTSLNTLYRFSSQLSSTHITPPMFLLAIKDFDSTIFGAVLSEPPSPTNRYTGNGESFVYTFKENSLKAFKWSGKNEYFQMGTDVSFSVGCDEGHCAIWLSEDLLHGNSQPCATFDSPQLSAHGTFKCQILELWSFSIY